MKAFLAVAALLGAAVSSSLPQKSEVAHFWHSQARARCGHVAGVETWHGSKLTLKFKHCTLVARFKVLTTVNTPTPPPPPSTATPTPTATATAIPTATATATSPPATADDYLLGLINAERQRVGSPPLTLNPALSTCALAHSQRMAAEGGISHDGFPNPDLCVSGWSRAGQNVGQDNPPVDQGVLNDFTLMMAEGHTPLGSCLDGHDCNITYSGYTSVGIGIYDDGRIWITETFLG